VKVELVKYTPDCEKLVAVAGKQTLTRKPFEEVWRSMSEEEVESWIRETLRRGHLSPWEHCVYTFYIEGISRVACYDGETEVLTKHGWKRISSVSLEDDVACMDDDGRFFWCKPQAKIVEEYKGAMVKISNESVSLLVTPEHNMWVCTCTGMREECRWQFVSAQAMLAGGCYKLAKSTVHDATETRNRNSLRAGFAERLSRLEPKVFELLGLLAGSVLEKARRERDDALAVEHVEERVAHGISECCKALGIQCEVRCGKSGRGCSVTIEPAGEVAHLIGEILSTTPSARRLLEFLLESLELLSSLQVRGFVQGFLRGLGEGSETAIVPCHKDVADLLQAVMVKSGLSATILSGSGNSVLLKVHNASDSWPVLCSGGDKGDISITHYTGNVYSLVVPYHKLYVRRKGRTVWSGNSHQLVRHRVASYSQFSQRYRIMKDEMLEHVVPPSIASKEDALSEYMRAHEEAIKAYRKLSELGIPPEDARYVLPQSVRTKILVTMNARELLHFFGLRMCTRAQWEIRAMAWLMWKRVFEVHPKLWRWAGPRCILSENSLRESPVTLEGVLNRDLARKLGLQEAGRERVSLVQERCPELVPRASIPNCIKRGLEEALDYIESSGGS